jgi:hypothetical protein
MHSSFSGSSSESGFPDQFLRRLIHEPAKSGIGISHDVGRSLDRGDGQRRVLGDRQAEARQIKAGSGVVDAAAMRVLLLVRLRFRRGFFLLAYALREAGGPGSHYSVWRGWMTTTPLSVMTYSRMSLL